MTRTIKARFSHGAFEPLEPAVEELVKEGEAVTIRIIPRRVTVRS